MQLLLPIKEIWNSRALNALSKSFGEASIAYQEDIGTIHQPIATRSLEWLEENGKSVDHIVPRKSTIIGAGHGASGSPLHYIAFKDDYTPMYRILNL